MRARELTAVGALALIAAITAAWWALALWPLPAEAPGWLARTRYVCFGTTSSGLPNGGGWVLLIAQPLSLIAVLMAIWGGAVRDGLRAAAARRWGRVALRGAVVALLVGVTAAAWRVRSAAASALPELATVVPATYPRLDREAPPLALDDHRGEPVTLERFRGRPVLLTFAYAHCETVCPLLVRDVQAARRRTDALAPAALVVTLDPWRDVPSRLPHIAKSWGLEGDELFLGGSVEEVEQVLEAWNVARFRDPATGEVEHPSLVYVLDREGRIAYAAAGGADFLVALLERL